MDAKFEITDCFSLISKKCIVLGGFIKKGKISIGDKIKFKLNKKTALKEIVGVEFFCTVPPSPKVGILIKADELEMNEFKSWNPNHIISTIKSNKQNETIN